MNVSVDMDAPINLGGPIKALGGGKIRGLAIPFGSPENVDFQGEFFTPRTNHWFKGAASRPILWHHGIKAQTGLREFGEATFKADDVDEAGRWFEAELDASDAYQKRMLQLAEAGKLYASTGSARHMYQRKRVGKAYEITSWPIVELSLTTTPVNPDARVMPLKAFAGLLGEPAAPPPSRPPVSLKAILALVDAVKADPASLSEQDRARLVAYRSVLDDASSRISDLLYRDRVDNPPNVPSLVNRARVLLAELEMP